MDEFEESYALQTSGGDHWIGREPLSDPFFKTPPVPECQALHGFSISRPNFRIHRRVPVTGTIPSWKSLYSVTRGCADHAKAH